MSAAGVRVLGPVELIGESGAAALTAKQRRLLAALVVGNGRACSVDELVDALWRDRPPASASKLVQVYVSQLRKALPPRVRVSTRPGAYALELSDELVDATRFERLVADSASARRDGNHALAGSLADQALALWRGRAYGELGYESFARLEVERLEELKLLAFEERLDAQLALGRHAEVIGELLAAATDNPLRERLQELALLALYRSGRQSDALEHYGSMRRMLREELGLEPGPSLRAMQVRILRHDPTLDTARERREESPALPESPTPLVGRERELEALRDMLARRDVRLLVLTGAGGSGKTRLALEAAREVASTFANGAVLVELAPLRDPALVVPTIAHAVGVAPNAEAQPLEALAHALHSRDLLLVVDNAEHVRAAAAAFVELLARAPRLTLLVTSRAVLHVSGEHVFPVAPLDEGAALELFEQRARSMHPQFRLTGDNETQVREICARVDRLPLAIELAAARVRTLAPEALLERLTERLSLLSGGPQDAPARQQTLRDTLDWSYDLLSDDERRFLARLSVFPSGATLDAAATVCLGDDGERALDLVERLLDASLVIPQERAGTVRYRLLETVRQYAAERLEEHGDTDPVRRRHAEHVLAFVERVSPAILTSIDRWVDEMARERDDIRAALEWSWNAGEAEKLLRLAKSVWRFWWIGGDLAEGRAWLDVALDLGADLDPVPRAEAHEGAAGLAWAQGDLDRAREHAQAALSHFSAAGDHRGEQAALTVLGHVALGRGDFDTARSLFGRSLRLAEQHADTTDAGVATHNLGSVAYVEGDLEAAERLYGEARSRYRAKADAYGVALSELYIGLVSIDAGRPKEAADCLGRALETFREMRFRQYATQCLEGIAAVVHARGDVREAVRLLASASALRERIGIAPSVAAGMRERELAATLAELGDDDFAAAWADGLARAEDEALDLACAAVDA